MTEEQFTTIVGYHDEIKHQACKQGTCRHSGPMSVDAYRAPPTVESALSTVRVRNHYAGIAHVLALVQAYRNLPEFTGLAELVDRMTEIGEAVGSMVDRAHATEPPR